MAKKNITRNNQIWIVVSFSVVLLLIFGGLVIFNVNKDRTSGSNSNSSSSSSLSQSSSSSTQVSVPTPNRPIGIIPPVPTDSPR